MLKVLAVGNTPPPFGGTAIMIDRFVKSDLADVKLIHIRMGFSSHMNEVGRVRLSKIVHMFAIIGRIFYHRFVDNVRILYYPPGGPDMVPMIRDIIILLSTRWLFDKTILHHHSGGTCELYDRLPSWLRLLYRRAYYHADAAVRISALNPEDGRLLKAKREFVIPNGIDDPFPDFSDSPPKSEATANNPMKILYVGILRESKGVLVLIEACGKLLSQGVPFHLELMGQWHSEEFAVTLRRRIQELKLENSITFLGMLTGDVKFAAYRRADVFCYPSFFNCESFGLVLAEAMACGLPTVSTRWRGIPSVVEDGETGFLVEPQDADALASHLATLAEDAELRVCMGRAGRVRFEREFTINRHLNRMREMLLQTAEVASNEQAKIACELLAAS